VLNFLEKRLLTAEGSWMARVLIKGSNQKDTKAFSEGRSLCKKQPDCSRSKMEMESFKQYL